MVSDASQLDRIAYCNDVTVHFEKASQPVLRNFSLNCFAGDFLVIVGKSGCGKTTVLNLLAGLVDVTTGVVRLKEKHPREARSHVGYMFARDALIPSRTAMGNVEIGLEVRGIGRAERRARSQELMNKLGLSGAEHRYPWQLSQGMRQRVALARTWALSPDLILMDEPFAALDAQTRESARAEFLHLWERQRSTVIFVTHDLTEALLMGDRVIMMGQQGAILRDLRISFPRPRNPSELPLSAEFRNLEHELRTSLADHH